MYMTSTGDNSLHIGTAERVLILTECKEHVMEALHAVFASEPQFFTNEALAGFYRNSKATNCVGQRKECRKIHK